VILGGDVGGTKTNLGLFEEAGGVIRMIRSAKYRSKDFPGLAAIITRFLEEGGPAHSIEAACFGIPGPVIDNRASTPNLAWLVDGPAIAAAAGIPAVLLANDLVATAEGLPHLDEDEVAVLQPGTPPGPGGNRALIAAGTGLGMALLPRIGDRWVPVPSEGGHADFAPRTEEEVGLMRYLRERFGRVSVERVVSGPGLFNIYSYLRDTHGIPESSQVREALARGDDPARVIGENALATPAACDLCSRAMDLFVAAYGAVAGNLALTGTATGGVYLGGGIAPKILPRLKTGLFLQTFEAKGRFVPYLERVPVKVILNDRAALLGAAWRAALLVC
jgi:glucokinase